MVTDLEALDYAEDATEAEIAAYRAARKAADEPAPNRAEQFRDLFLVSLPGHPRAVPVVGIVGIEPNGAHVLDRAWVFWPGHGPAAVRCGDTFDRIADVLRLERQAVGDIVQPFAIPTGRADSASGADAHHDRLDELVRAYHVEKLSRSSSVTAGRARDELIAALPAPAPLPPLQHALGRRRELLGAHEAVA